MFSNLELSSGSKYGGKLINSEDTRILKVMKKSKEEYRPDVTHHVIIINFNIVFAVSDGFTSQQGRTTSGFHSDKK